MSVPETWLPWESCGSSLGSSTLSCTVADAPVGSVYTSASACSTKIEQDTTQTRTYIASSSVSNIMYALGARSCACTPQLGNRFVSCVWAGAPPHGGADHVCFKHEAPCSVSPVSVCTNFSLERFRLTRFMLHAVHSFHVVHAVHDSSGSRFMGSHY